MPHININVKTEQEVTSKKEVLEVIASLNFQALNLIAKTIKSKTSSDEASKRFVTVFKTYGSLF